LFLFINRRRKPGLAAVVLFRAGFRATKTPGWCFDEQGLD